MKEQSKIPNTKPWIVCFGCILVLFCTTGLAAGGFAVFQPYLLSDIGLTGVQASSIVTLRSLFAVLGTALIIPFYKRIGYRLGLTLNVVLIAAGYFIYSVADNYAQCIAGMACIGIAHGMGSMVATSVVLGRWFRYRRGFAIGLCAAGSGLATVIVPPVITGIINTYSLKTAFLTESAAICVLAVITFLTVRNAPSEEKGETALQRADGDAAEKEKTVHKGRSVGKRELILMILAYVMIGGPAVAGYSHLSVLYRTVGHDSVFVSLMLSILGLSLMVSKTLYGIVADKIGGYRAGWFFHAFLITAAVLCCFANSGSRILVILSMLFYGFGVPINTVGLSINAELVSDEENYAKVMNSFQMAFQLGAMAMDLIPGAVADITGSYIPSYALFAVLAVVEMLIIQRIVGKNSRRASLPS